MLELAEAVETRQSKVAATLKVPEHRLAEVQAGQGRPQEQLGQPEHQVEPIVAAEGIQARTLGPAACPARRRIAPEQELLVLRHGRIRTQQESVLGHTEALDGLDGVPAAAAAVALVG